MNNTGIQPDINIPATKHYKRYVALMNQTSTNPPTAIELQNELGTLQWSRVAAGVYRCVGTGGAVSIFKQTRTALFMCPNRTIAGFRWIDSSTLEITCSNTSGSGIDDYLTDTAVEIRVYNTLLT